MTESNLPTKLKPLLQWYCDSCGEVIESPEDGMLEWKSFLHDDSEGYNAKDFRIVHGDWIKVCRKKRYEQVDLSDGHLEWFLGYDGLNRLLTYNFMKNLDAKKLATIIKRLHIKYFEEARTYIPLAHSEGYNEMDPYNIGDINQGDSVSLIRKYSSER